MKKGNEKTYETPSLEVTIFGMQESILGTIINPSGGDNGGFDWNSIENEETDALDMIK
jgi:hypothetical protein